MKKSTSFLHCAAWLAAVLALIPAVVSCGSSDGTTASDTTAAVTETAAETVDPNDRSQIKDNLPDDLDFDGRQFTVYVGNRTYNEDYIAGPEEETGEIVDDAV